MDCEDLLEGYLAASKEHDEHFGPTKVSADGLRSESLIVIDDNWIKRHKELEAAREAAHEALYDCYRSRWARQGR